MKQAGQPKQTLRSNLLKRQQQRQQQQHQPRQQPNHTPPNSQPQPQQPNLSSSSSQTSQPQNQQQQSQQHLPNGAYQPQYYTQHQQQQQQLRNQQQPSRNAGNIPHQNDTLNGKLPAHQPPPNQKNRNQPQQVPQYKIQQRPKNVNQPQPQQQPQQQQRQNPQSQQSQRYPGPHYSHPQHQQHNQRRNNERARHREIYVPGKPLRKIPVRDRDLFLNFSRYHLRLDCLYKPGVQYLGVPKLKHNDIQISLAKCETMEHQILSLRDKISLNSSDFQQRYNFTQLLLNCLKRHHNQVYEGVLFGSTINGLGFKDSDVDLRLRLIKRVDDCTYEPEVLNDDMVERTLRDIAYQTNMCCPCFGEFVPSTRCPVAKLSFQLLPANNPNPNLIEGLKYDVSLSSNNSLGSFNTLFLRFLCSLEPKFHLLATVIRYWTKAHELIVPGYLSSYAVVNMLIFFCQVTEPPLLPTVDHMRDLYFTYEHDRDEILKKTGLTQLEWHTIICLRKELYTPSRNTEPLSVLLLKFFEFYLKFPYSTHIITTRPGRALTHDEFKESSHFHPGFPIRSYLNIQDPFDLRHNLTNGMNEDFFKKFIMVVSHSYEVLFFELKNRFRSPPRDQIMLNPHTFKRDDSNDWGINALFVRLSKFEIAREPPKNKDKKPSPNQPQIKKPPPPPPTTTDNHNSPETKEAATASISENK